ncbi:MAG TPA: TetR/AcrR family transcriptional regulator [Burkholderiales bacterium]
MNLPERERRWSRRKEARPEEITAAALELFSERGYAATRLEDVAARAGVSKGTLYLYFSGKEELFKAVLREGFISPLTEMRETVQRHQGATFELVEMLVRGWWQRIGATRLSAIPKLIVAEARNFPELARFYVDEVVRPGHQAIAAIVRRGVERGEFREVDPDVAGRLLIAPLFMVALWRNSLAACTPERIDPVPLLEAHIEMLRHGLAAQPRDVRHEKS